MLLHVTVTYLIGMFYLVTIVSICIMEEIKSRTPHLFHGILSECVSLICGFLIYVTALLLPRFPKLKVANLKVKKNLKNLKNHVGFKSTNFFAEVLVAMCTFN